MSDTGVGHVKYHVRWMIRCDMAEVLDIERAAFEFPWFEDDFIRCLRQRNCIGMVAERASQIVGYILYQLFPRHIAILNVAVREDARRQGIGSHLVDRLKSKLSEQRRRKITADVWDENLAAQWFFKRQWFLATEIVSDHWDNPRGNDAYRFEYQYDTKECQAAADKFRTTTRKATK